MLTALVGLASAIVTIVLTNVGAVAVDIIRRKRKTRDFVLALHAEIAASLRNITQQTEASEQSYSMADPDPFAVADETNFVFEALKDDLTILPQDVIHSVVAYYKLTMQTNLLTAAMRDPQFADQPPDAKRKFVRGLLRLSEEQRRVGMFTRDILEAHGGKLGLNLHHEREALDRALAQPDVGAPI